MGYTGKDLQIGKENVKIYDSLPTLRAYNPKKEHNDITISGLAAVRIDGTRASPAELGALLEMQVLLDLWKYTEAKMGIKLNAMRGEMGGSKLIESGDGGARIRERQELDITFTDNLLRYICWCQVKHREAGAGADVVSALVDKARSLTLELVTSHVIPSVEWIREMDLYLIASAGSNLISVEPGARYRIGVSYPAQQQLRGLNPLPDRAKLEWLDPRRLEERYWGRMKHNQGTGAFEVIGNPEIYLPTNLNRGEVLEIAAEVELLLKEENQRLYPNANDSSFSDRFWKYARQKNHEAVGRNLQREWARLSYSSIMRLAYIMDDLILRRHVSDYCGIEVESFGNALADLEGRLADAHKGDFSFVNSFATVLGHAVPFLKDTYGKDCTGNQGITKTEADPMINGTDELIGLMHKSFDRVATSIFLMTYDNNLLRLRVEEGENFVLGPPNNYLAN